MKLKKLMFLIGTSFAVYGNTFAVSEYATTIQNNTPKKSFLSATSFPTTAADASFVERIDSKREGYKPYFNRSAFSDLTIEEQDELESMAHRAEFESQSMPNYYMQPNQTYNPNYSETNPTIQPEETTVVATPTPMPSTIPTQITHGLYMSVNLTPENIAKYNLKTHDGGCTPPERNNIFTNRILTSGQYQTSAPTFEKFMITAFRKEGDCGADKDGWSCYGCYSKGLCAGIDMSTITRAKVEDLAYQKFYQKYNVDKLPDAFRGYAMWGIWGSGPITGIKTFQKALGVPTTAKIDDATIVAAQNYTGDFADAYTKTEEEFYRNIVRRDPTQQRFLNGWLNSLELLRPSGCHVVPNDPIFR